MSLQPILVAGQWCQAKNPSGAFSAVDPESKTALAESYPVSGMDDVTLACEAAYQAACDLRSVSPESLAHFLDEYAARIEARVDQLVELAARETGLPRSPRLRLVELGRRSSELD